ncbi:GntR family transcriptional regulator [Spirochaetia bacterium]|nr:GntR family transcriptional regulator [Spirochaetia bacterium]
MEESDREDRLTQIFEFIKERKTASVEAICRTFSISQSTVRRMLISLERENRINRFRGGAIAILQNTPELPVMRRMEVMETEKRALARHAVRYIHDRDTILLTSGSTIRHLTGLLDGFSQLTVLTDSILVLNDLMYKKNINLVMLGGQVYLEEQCTYGFLPADNASHFKINTMFTSVKSISVNHGFMTDDLQHMPYYRKLMQLSEKVIVLADHNKFYIDGTAILYHFSEVDRLLTGDAVPDPLAVELKEKIRNVDLCGL